MNRPFRKPLVLLSHKFLLHHGPCTSALHDFATGTFFNRLIDDGKASDNTRHKSTRPDGTPFLLPPHAIRRVILCSGAFYYKLSQVRAPDSDAGSGAEPLAACRDGSSTWLAASSNNSTAAGHSWSPTPSHRAAHAHRGIEMSSR